MHSNSSFDAEVKRLASLYSLNVLDTEPEASFDGLVEIAASVCEVPIALISLIDDDRQWFKAKTGILNIDQTPRDISICSHTIAGSEEILEIPDTRIDSRVCHTPLVTNEPGIQFYAGAKLTMQDGAVIGTLCVIDTKPGTLTNAQRQVLLNLARAASGLLEARKTSEALANSESKLQGLCDASPLGIFSSDKTGSCNYNNTRCQQILGKSEQQILGRGWQESLHEDDKDEVLALLLETLREHRTFNRSFRIVHPDGQTRYARAIAAPTFNSDGSPNGSVGIIEDTTERILENRALIDEQSRLASIIQGTGTGTWEWNIQTGDFRVNQRFRDISGHPEKTFTNVCEAQSLVHSDDRKQADAILQQHLSGQKERYETENRIKRDDATWSWVLDCGQIVTRSADGAPEWLYGTRLDINERKLQAQELIKAQDQMATDQRRTAVTQERLRLARDMHDTLAHSLMAVLTQIRVVRKLRTKLSESDLEQELHHLEDVTVTGIAEARAAITQIRHNNIDEIGLDGAIQSLCDRFTENTGIPTKLRINKNDASQVRKYAETLFRIIEEALHNIERHSKASRVSIRLTPPPATRTDPAAEKQSSHQFRLSIADDGVGFNPDDHYPGHYGLQGIQEQVTLINGVFLVKSMPNRGTTLRVDFSV